MHIICAFTCTQNKLFLQSKSIYNVYNQLQSHNTCIQRLSVMQAQLNQAPGMNCAALLLLGLGFFCLFPSVWLSHQSPSNLIANNKKEKWGLSRAASKHSIANKRKTKQEKKKSGLMWINSPFMYGGRPPWKSSLPLGFPSSWLSVDTRWDSLSLWSFHTFLSKISTVCACLNHYICMFVCLPSRSMCVCVYVCVCACVCVSTVYVYMSKPL